MRQYIWKIVDFGGAVVLLLVGTLYLVDGIAQLFGLDLHFTNRWGDMSCGMATLVYGLRWLAKTREGM